MIDVASVQELVGRWWWNYDEGNFGVLPSLVTEDVHFTCRTDTGQTDFEDFVRADMWGRDTVVDWQTRHRMDSPYPLRHMGVNIHLVDAADTEATFASYLFVTHLVEHQVTNLSSAVVTGSVRREDGALRLSGLHVVLDTRSSVLFVDR